VTPITTEKNDTSGRYGRRALIAGEWSGARLFEAVYGGRSLHAIDMRLFAALRYRSNVCTRARC
jgi:hypothetical protein